MVIVAIGKDSFGIAFGIVVLVRTQAPEERNQADSAENQRNGNQDRQDVHSVRPRRMALSETTIELADMAMAAMSGVTKPAKAIGTVTML